jgi:hypothetical protein
VAALNNSRGTDCTSTISDGGVLVQSVLALKYNRMTLLVGMIGSDGIVLAADQNRVLPADADGNFDDQMLGPKIYHNGRHRIAYAVAGDDHTDGIGYRLEQYIADGSLEPSENRAPRLQALVKRAIADIQAEREPPHKDELVIERTILLVLYASQT